MLLHFPQGVIGWTVSAFGLLVVAYRLHGVDAPRTWIEGLERQFTYMIQLRFLGGILLLLGAAPLFFAQPDGPLGVLFLIATAVAMLVGFGLLLFQNHVRSLVIATAEGKDMNIRIVSIIITLLGLGFMVAPFFF
jgi:hypothetical protein